MKGYYVADGYMGYVGSGYRLFADESDYMEYIETEEEYAEDGYMEEEEVA